MTRRPHPLARALALAALAGMPGASALPRPAEATLPSDADRARWQERVGAARTELERARRRSEAAEEAVQQMRHRRRPRGEAREALFAEREAARAACSDAERALDELLEQARRAGVPPGWLRAEDAPPADAPE